MQFLTFTDTSQGTNLLV